MTHSNYVLQSFFVFVCKFVLLPPCRNKICIYGCSVRRPSHYWRYHLVLQTAFGKWVVLSLSEACHIDVAASMSWCHIDLSKAHCLAVARPKLSRHRSSKAILNQICLDLLVQHCQPLVGPKRSRMVSTGVGTTKVATERQAPSTDSICLQWLICTKPNHVIGDKIRPVDMENTSEAAVIQCIYFSSLGLRWQNL